MAKLNTKLAVLGAKQALGIMVDPAPAYKFFIYVELSGVIEAKFTEVSGLSVEREVETYYEGGNNDRVHHLPGRIKYGNITLKRGVTFSRTLWDWFHKKPTSPTGGSAKYGIVNKIPLSIILYSPYSVIPARWYDLEEAFPVKLVGPSLNTDSNEIAIEELEIAYSKLTLSQPSEKLGGVNNW
jgi:phage tail-like protein